MSEAPLCRFIRLASATPPDAPHTTRTTPDAMVAHRGGAVSYERVAPVIQHPRIILRILYPPMLRTLQVPEVDRLVPRAQLVNLIIVLKE